MAWTRPCGRWCRRLHSPAYICRMVTAVVECHRQISIREPGRPTCWPTPPCAPSPCSAAAVLSGTPSKRCCPALLRPRQVGCCCSIALVLLVAAYSVLAGAQPFLSKPAVCYTQQTVFHASCFFACVRSPYSPLVLPCSAGASHNRRLYNCATPAGGSDEPTQLELLWNPISADTQCA